MANQIRITGQAYYDVMPSSDLQVGDIWNEMPTLGHLGRQCSSAVVITPACDLSNRKSETLTYLPVIPVREFLVGRSFAVELVRVIKAQEATAGINRASSWIAKVSDLPALEAIKEVHDDASTILANKTANEKIKSAVQRCLSASKVLMACRQGLRGEIRDVRVALGEKEYSRILTEIVRNSYSSDLHFMPADGRRGVASAMKEHAVALFRYPLCLPVELLQAANDIAVADWDGAIGRLAIEHPIARHTGTRPIKVATMRSPYLADLISRFAGLHIRMGSPDFTGETIGQYVQDIEGER